MFFVLSKTLGALILPLNLGLVLLAAWFVARIFGRLARTRRVLLGAGAGVLLIFSLPVTAELLLRPLEGAFARPARLPDKPRAIVMLTGMTRPSSRGLELTESADRFVWALRLARRFPEARLVLSGGSSAIFDTRYREATALGRVARELGVPATQLLIERDSRNTYENAVNSARVLKQLGLAKGPVLLVTSAFHMRRAVGCFRKAGVSGLVPWPVDYHSAKLAPTSFVPRLWGMALSQRALKEHAGQLIYRLTGRL